MRQLVYCSMTQIIVTHFMNRIWFYVSIKWNYEFLCFLLSKWLIILDKKKPLSPEFTYLFSYYLTLLYLAMHVGIRTFTISSMTRTLQVEFSNRPNGKTFRTCDAIRLVTYNYAVCNNLMRWPILLKMILNDQII